MDASTTVSSSTQTISIQVHHSIMCCNLIDHPFSELLGVMGTGRQRGSSRPGQSDGALASQSGLEGEALVNGPWVGSDRLKTLRTERWTLVSVHQSLYTCAPFQHLLPQQIPSTLGPSKLADSFPRMSPKASKNIWGY